MNPSARRNRKRRVVENRVNGECRYYTSGNVILVVRNNSIVTVLRRDGR